MADDTALIEQNGETLASRAVPTPAEIVDAYLMDLDACPKTKRTYRSALERYLDFLEEEGIPFDQVRRRDIIAYKERLEQTRSAATTNAYLVAVRGLYRWLNMQTGYPDVASEVKGVHKKAAIGHDALSLEQTRTLLSRTGESVEDLRDHAMLNLMARRGLRTIEVSRANVGDMRQTAGVAVLYVQGKGHAAKDDFVILGEDVERPIRDYLKARGKADDDEPLFASVGNRSRGGRLTTRTISRIVKEAYKAEGIDDPHITAHSLRHTAVTLSLKGGATPQEAQAMARHRSISTTMIYAHNLERMNAGAERSVDALLDGTVA